MLLKIEWLKKLWGSMEKMAGRFQMLSVIFLLFLSSIVQASGPSIVLSISDMDRKPIQQAMVQSKFMLQVSINNFNPSSDISYIPGMDPFRYVSMGAESNSYSYNGRMITKIIYKFMMRADQKGVYKVGPLALTDSSGRSIESNILSISVGDDLVSLQQNSQAEKYMIETKLDKKSVYVGEKVILQVDFLDRTYIDQYSLLLPEFENIIVTNPQQKQRVTIQHTNGQEYADTQWTLDVYPTVKGLSIFENIKIRFVNQDDSNNIFGRFFGMYAEQELRARPIGLQVLELPVVSGFENITAVGQFSKLELSVNKNSVEQGQGIVLTADIFGDGNFEMIESLSLSLPENLVSYDSDTPKMDTRRTRKHFEYIIQAQSVGQYQIPAQQFKYFDPADRQYKILQSNPIDILIAADITAQQHDNQQQLDLFDEDKDTNEKTIEDFTVLEPNLMQTDQLSMIPLSWYTKFLQFLYFIFFLMMVYRYVIKKYLFTYDRFQHTVIFFKAKRACQLAAKHRNVIALHPLFIDLFVNLKVGSQGFIRDEMIERYLKNKNFSDETVDQWKLFYNKLLQISFAGVDRQNDEFLFQEAFTWIARLKERA